MKKKKDEPRHEKSLWL